VEHLRTVHFTLIALCVGLIVLASFPSKSQIQLAHDQVLEILGANPFDPNIFEYQVRKQRKAFIEADSARNLIVSPNDSDDTVFAQFQLVAGPNADVSLQPEFNIRDWTTRLDHPVETRQLFEVFPEYMSSLQSFQKMWDSLLGVQADSLPRMPKECFAGELRRDRNSRNLYPLLTPCEIRPIDTPPPTAATNATPQREMQFQRATSSDYDGAHQLILDRLKTPDWQYEFGYMRLLDEKAPRFFFFILPVRQFKEVGYDGHRIITQQFPRWRQNDRRFFKDAFPELADVYEPFKDVPISSAANILQAESKRTGDAFEAAGLKIPADMAVRCGVLLVLGVQLYMLIHLREFGSRLDREAGFEVAWIGVYVSRLARLMLFSSLLVLPACTVVLLSVRALTMTEHSRLAWAALIASNAASLALAYFLFKVLPQPPPETLPAAEQSALNPVQLGPDVPVEQHSE